MNRRSLRQVLAVAAVIWLLLLAGCTDDQGTGSGAGAPSGTAASQSSTTARKTVGFDETYRFDDGITVTIKDISKKKLKAYDSSEDTEAKPGDPYIKLTTEFTNGTTEDLALGLDAVAKYGPESTKAATVGVIEMNPPENLAPGESGEYDFGYLIPPESYGQVVVEVTLTSDPLRTAVFSGAVE